MTVSWGAPIVQYVIANEKSRANCFASTFFLSCPYQFRIICFMTYQQLSWQAKMQLLNKPFCKSSELPNCTIMHQ